MPKICFLQTLKIDMLTSLGNMYLKLLENKTEYLKVIRESNKGASVRNEAS